MATNPTTDLTEEDAADLQFPKEFRYSDSSDLEASIQTCAVCFNITRVCSCCKCAKCKEPLQVPFIECAVCENISLCCRCFASGSELSTHKSDHNYRVLQNDFILFDHSTWTAAEELIMLDVLFTYGYGNWEAVASKLGNRTAREVKEHYNSLYIDSTVSHLLPKVSETVQSVFPRITVPFRYKLLDVEEPPRHAPHTLGYRSIAGYNAARSDFECDYDANAEELLAALCPSDVAESVEQVAVLADLQCAIVDSYNRRLKERQRRKRIVRNHGLILMRKTMTWMHRYDGTLGRGVTERLTCFKQFLSGCDFDFLVEGLHRAAELRQRISRLREYRQRGIKSLEAADVYDSAKAHREQCVKELHAFTSHPVLNWKKITSAVHVQPTSVPHRRVQFRPLEIVGLPGVEKLSLKEQELCSTVRLVPQTYIELKDLLVTENKKFGYLKLQTARKMLKIDVNKTRKLYDFLAREGYIVTSAK